MSMYAFTCDFMECLGNKKVISIIQNNKVKLRFYDLVYKKTFLMINDYLSVIDKVYIFGWSFYK